MAESTRSRLASWLACLAILASPVRADEEVPLRWDCPELVAIYRDGSLDERVAAVREVVGCRDREVLTAVLALIPTDDRSLSRQVHRALYAAGESALPALVMGLSSSSSKRRERALELILALQVPPHGSWAKHPYHSPLAPELLPVGLLTSIATTDESPTARSRALAILGRSTEAEVFELLLEATCDSDDGVRSSAVGAIARQVGAPRPGPTGAPDLTQARRRARRELARAEVTTRLLQNVELSREGAGARLLRLLATVPDPKRDEILAVLLDGPEDKLRSDVLISVIRADDGHRERAMQAIVTSSDRRLQGRLNTLLREQREAGPGDLSALMALHRQETNYRTKQRQLELMTRFGGEEVGPFLASVVRDEPHLGVTALRCLTELRDIDSLAVVLEVPQEKLGLEHLRALAILGARGADRLGQLLTRRLTRQKLPVEPSRSLKPYLEAEPEHLLPTLRTLSEHEEEFVRLNVVRFLSWLPGPEVEALLTELTKNENRRVWVAARDVLARREAYGLPTW